MEALLQDLEFILANLMMGELFLGSIQNRNVEASAQDAADGNMRKRL